MSSIDPMFWNEHGERVEVMISSSDAGIEDIPRVMREHRDLRRALTKAVEMLQICRYQPDDPKFQDDLAYIMQIKKRNPI